MHQQEETFEELYGMAYLLFQQGKYPYAVHTFRLLTALAPEDSRIWFGLGASLQMSQAYQEAIEAFILADAWSTTKDPRPPFHAAECCISMGKNKEAQKALVEAKKRAINENTPPLLDRITLYEKRNANHVH